MTEKNDCKTVDFADASFLMVIVNEDEIAVTGYNNKDAAVDALDKAFQWAIPEELTLSHLEGEVENMREPYGGYPEEIAYYRSIFNQDEYDRLCQMCYDARNRFFDYDGAYFDGKTATYKDEFIGEVFKRNAFNLRYSVVWNDADSVNHKEFADKGSAVQKLRELFLATIPEDKNDENFMKRVQEMQLDEGGLGFMDDVAYNVEGDHPFQATIVDLGK